MIQYIVWFVNRLQQDFVILSSCTKRAFKCKMQSAKCRITGETARYRRGDPLWSPVQTTTQWYPTHHKAHQKGQHRNRTHYAEYDRLGKAEDRKAFQRVWCTTLVDEKKSPRFRRNYMNQCYNGLIVAVIVAPENLLFIRVLRIL